MSPSDTTYGLSDSCASEHKAPTTFLTAGACSSGTPEVKIAKRAVLGAMARRVVRSWLIFIVVMCWCDEVDAKNSENTARLFLNELSVITKRS